MTPEERIYTFIELGKDLQNLSEVEKEDLFWKAKANNYWFTPENIQLALDGIVRYLQPQSLLQWTSAYTLDLPQPKKVGLVMAGNIPAAGFHDFMCVLLSGHQLLAKLSSQDNVLLPEIARIINNISPEFSQVITFAERLNEAEAIIATGSDNSARYFHYYFKHLPNVIRQNRTSCAIIKGDETSTQLTELGNDIFQYFGLGCRNVSKLYVPEEYSFTHFFETIEPWNQIMQHHKYVNNYDYNKSIYLVNQQPHQDNGFLLLKEDKALVSPVSVVYYELYTDEKDLQEKLNLHTNKIQCIVSKDGWFPRSIAFGQAQRPVVWDYADNVDTMQFLTSL